MRRALAALLLLAWSDAGAQAVVTISDVGPGASGRLLREALAQPHRIAEPDTARFILSRGMEVRGTLIVLGRDATIEGQVDGDVIVVGGDLFVRPGGRVVGRAIAIGGGAYPSSLGFVGGGTESFHYNTFDIERSGDGYRLSYRSLEEGALPPLLFPDVYGFRPPQYDRVNGLSIPFGPALAVGGDRGRVDILATYRSDLGVIDPSLRAGYQFTRRTRMAFDARRGSFSNDEWIYRNLVNSLTVLTLGVDTRNWYRADRAEFTLHRLWEGRSTRWEPFVGALTERDWSVGPGVGALSGPWSVLWRKDTLGMRRPNPAIEDGSVSSALVGLSVQWESEGVRASVRTRAEALLAAPKDERLVQTTTDVLVNFPTFGEQDYEIEVHWVTTAGDSTPRQRWVYLGGPGSLPFHDPLVQGGDQLLLVDQRYSIPLSRVTVGAFGIPVLQLRHRVAAAGLRRVPALEQMIGLGLSLTVIRGEIQVDPVARKVRATTGFTFSR